MMRGHDFSWMFPTVACHPIAPEVIFLEVFLAKTKLEGTGVERFEAMAVFKETFNAPDRTMNLASDGVWPECPAIPGNAQPQKTKWLCYPVLWLPWSRELL